MFHIQRSKAEKSREYRRRRKANGGKPLGPTSKALRIEISGYGGRTRWAKQKAEASRPKPIEVSDEELDRRALLSLEQLYPTL